MPVRVVLSALAAPCLAVAYLYARARGRTVGWEQRHRVLSTVALVASTWTVAAWVALIPIAMLVAGVVVSRAVSTGVAWALGLTLLFSVGYAAERLAILADRRFPRRRPTRRRMLLGVACLLLLCCLAGVVGGPQQAVGTLATAASLLAGILVASPRRHPRELPPAIG